MCFDSENYLQLKEIVPAMTIACVSISRLASPRRLVAQVEISMLLVNLPIVLHRWNE